ncbi:ribosome maturation factor RimM [Niabella aquatica]
MNTMKEYISIGKIAGTHGLKGEVVLKHALGKKTAFKGLKAIFLKDKSGSFLPWFPEESKIKSDTETYLKLESIDTVEQAKTLHQKEVWLAQADFKKYASGSAPISLLGYTIIEGDKELGTIEEIIEQPHQVLCRLHIEQKEVFIPLHEETLKKADAKNKKLFVELPDGLLDIYLT